jgi:hypothetical protein
METQSKKQKIVHHMPLENLSPDPYQSPQSAINRVSIQSLLIESSESPEIFKMAETLLSIQTSSFRAESNDSIVPSAKIPSPTYGISAPLTLQTPPGDCSPEPSPKMEFLVQNPSSNSTAEYEEFKNSILKTTKKVSNQEKGQLLAKAAAHGDLATIELLIENYSVHPGTRNNMALVEASKAGHFHVVDYLMNMPRVNPTAQHHYALKMAALHGHLDILNRILESPKVDPTYDQNYALRTACSQGHVEMLKFLLKDKRIDPSVREYLALRKADINGHFEIVDLLLSDPRTDKGDVIIAAIKHNRKAHKNLLKKLGVRSRKDSVPTEE